MPQVDIFLPEISVKTLWTQFPKHKNYFPYKVSLKTDSPRNDRGIPSNVKLGPNSLKALFVRIKLEIALNVQKYI